jgi:hypothetical protein
MTAPGSLVGQQQKRLTTVILNVFRVSLRRHCSSQSTTYCAMPTKPSKHAIVNVDATNVSQHASRRSSLLRHSAGILSPACREGRNDRCKRGVEIILRGILGLDLAADVIPTGLISYINPLLDTTIVEASRVPRAEGVQIEVDN